MPSGRDLVGGTGGRHRPRTGHRHGGHRCRCAGGARTALARDAGRSTGRPACPGRPGQLRAGARRNGLSQRRAVAVCGKCVGCWRPAANRWASPANWRGGFPRWTSTPECSSSSTALALVRPGFMPSRRGSVLCVIDLRTPRWSSTGHRARRPPAPASCGRPPSPPRSRIDSACSTGGGRTAQPRQQTLEASVAWSYDLLERIRTRAAPTPVGVQRWIRSECRRGGVPRRDHRQLLGSRAPQRAG